MVADAIVGRWLVVVCGSVALGLFARHLGVLRRASEDRFQRGFADSPIGMAIITPGLALARGQRRALRDARAQARGAGRPVAGRGHPPGRHRAQPRGRRPRAAGTGHQHFVKRYLRPDGEVVWAAVESIFVPGRRGDGWFYAHVQDITAQRAAQEAVERQARQQAAVAALGRYALEEQDLEAVMDRVARDASPRRSRSSCAPSSRSRRSGSALRLAAGDGWPEGQVRRALVPNGPRARSATR